MRPGRECADVRSSGADPVGRRMNAPGTVAYHGGSGEPLVLLHGATLSWRVWSEVIPHLCERHDVFAPTLPGHRGGAAFAGGVDGLVDAVCDQLDAEGITTAHVAGNSLGGWIALELARRGRARSVVAFSPAGASRARRDAIRLAALFRVLDQVSRRASMHRLLASAPARQWVFSRLCDRRLTRSQATAILEDLAGCTVLSGLLDSLPTENVLRPLHPAPCPITVAWAVRDRTISLDRHGIPVLQAVPDARFVPLPGVGHVPMLDDPALVARTILGTTARPAARSSQWGSEGSRA